MLLCGDGLEQIFDDLVHKDTVVTLSGEASVGTGEIFSESTARQEAHTTAALSADSGSARVVPSHQSLNDRAKRRDFPAEVLRLESISHKVIEDVEGESASKKRQERILLKLVVHNGDSAKTLWSDTLALLSILDSKVEAATSTSKGDGGDTDTATKEAFSHSEETCARFLDLRLEDTI